MSWVESSLKTFFISKKGSSMSDSEQGFELGITSTKSLLVWNSAEEIGFLKNRKKYLTLKLYQNHCCNFPDSSGKLQHSSRCSTTLIITVFTEEAWKWQSSLYSLVPCSNYMFNSSPRKSPLSLHPALNWTKGKKHQTYWCHNIFDKNSLLG